MTGRHRRWQPAPIPGPDALAAEVTALIDSALDAIDDRRDFECAVLDAFSEVIWTLQSDRRLVSSHSEPETALPAMMAASTVALPAVVDATALRLDSLAAATGARLDDPESLAEILVRLAHAVLLIPRIGPGARIDVDAYVQRHVAPVVRYAVSGRVAGIESEPGLPRLRRFRGELVVATLVAVMIGSVGWITVVSRSAPPSVMPTNLTATVPEPGSDVTPVQTISTPATPSQLQPSDAPAAPTTPDWTSKHVAPPSASAPATAGPAASDDSGGLPALPAGAPPGVLPPTRIPPTTGTGGAVGGSGQPVAPAVPPGSAGPGRAGPSHAGPGAGVGGGGHP
jgi:hypothetical protein